MGQRCDCGMATPSLTWCPVFLLEVGSISSLSLLWGIPSNVPPFDSWESLTSQFSDAFWRVPPTSYFLRPVFILCVGPQDFSSCPLPNTRSDSLLPHTSPHPVQFPSHFPPSFPTSPLVIAFLSLPSGTEASLLGHFGLLTSLSSVDYILGILYSFLFCFVFWFFGGFFSLISTY
jgi:hypothetical protein